MSGWGYLAFTGWIAERWARYGGRGRGCGVGFLIAMLATTAVCGQRPHVREHALGRNVRSADPGLLYVDGDHQLWVGTTRGLYRYVAGRSVLYPLAGAGSPEVTAVADLPGLGLRVGYADGTIALLRNDRLQRWLPEEGTPRAPITGFAADAAGQWWIATYGEGLYCVAANGRVYNLDETDGLPSRDIYSICTDADGGVWAGTDAGLVRCTFSPAAGKSVVVLRQADGLPDDIVLSLAPANDGVWVGTHQGGIARLNPRTLAFTAPSGAWPHGPVKRLEAFGPGAAIFLSEGGRVEQFSLSGHSNKLVDGRFRALHFGPEGNLWLLDRGGDLLTASLRFFFPESIPEEVQAVAPRADGDIWYGTTKGIYRSGPDGQFIPRPVPGSASGNILCLVDLAEESDEAGQLLAGTFGQGLLVCEQGQCRTVGEEAGLTNPNVLAIAVGADSLWLATLGGVFAAARPDQDARPLRFTRLAALGSDFFYHASVDHQGVLWLGSDGRGLLRYENGSVREYDRMVKDGDSVSVTSVLGVLPDADNGLWVTTQNHGVLHFHDELFYPAGFPEAESERTELGSALLTGSGGELLVAYPGGVDIRDPETGYWFRYGEEYGFIRAGGALNAVARPNDEGRWFVSGGLPVRYHPSARLPGRPAVILACVTANGDTLDQAGVRLDHRANHLVFHYRGNWLSDPESLTYRYRLRGQDREWITTTDDQATYSRLPPGNYVFELKAGPYGQFPDEPAVAFPFTIAPPYWRRWWVVSGTIATLAAGIYWLGRRRRQHRETLHRLEREGIRSELVAIRSQINPHFLFNSFSTLMATIEESPELAVTYTEQLSTFFRHVLSTQSRELVPLSEELDLARNYAFLLEHRYGDCLHVSFQLADQGGMLPPFSLQILIENAVKHNVVSQRMPLRVVVERRGGAIVVTNPLQPRTRPVESTGYGLSSIRRRYELLGKHELRTVVSEGVFSVFLPLL